MDFKRIAPLEQLVSSNSLALLLIVIPSLAHTRFTPSRSTLSHRQSYVLGSEHVELKNKRGGVYFPKQH
jgi:hypothetical protein